MSDRPRLLAVMPLGTRTGGAETMLLDLLRHPGESGLDCAVAFLEPGPLAEEAAALGAQVWVEPAGRLRNPVRFRGATSRLAEVGRDYRADVLCGWMTKGAVYSGAASRVAGLPSIWHQLAVPAAGLLGLDRHAARFPHAGVVVCSEALVPLQQRVAPSVPVRVVHPGADRTRFDPDRLPPPAEARRICGVPPDRPLVGMVGRLQAWKGFEYLLEAVALLRCRGIEIRAALVGGTHDLEPSYPAYLRHEIERMELADLVTMPGHRSDVPLWMQAMDVVVHHSDFEPFGLVVVEAMTLGKPVIAGAGGGPAEVIRPGEDGLLCPHGDADGLAAAIRSLLEDPDRAARMGRAARETASRFTTERYARDFGAAVRSLLAEARR